MEVVVTVVLFILLFALGGLTYCYFSAWRKDVKAAQPTRKPSPKGPNPYDIDLEKCRPNVLGSEIRRV